MGGLKKLKREIKKKMEELRRSMYDDSSILYFKLPICIFLNREPYRVIVFRATSYEVYPNEISLRGDSEEMAVDEFVNEYIKSEKFGREICKRIKEELKKYKS